MLIVYKDRRHSLHWIAKHGSSADVRAKQLHSWGYMPLIYREITLQKQVSLSPQIFVKHSTFCFLLSHYTGINT